MKKKLFVIIPFIACAMVCGHNIYSTQKTDFFSKLVISKLEALATPETDCRNMPGSNTGKCKLKVDGSGASCVTSSWYETNDCYK